MSMSEWNGTAWWGQCPHCLTYFSGHRGDCPTVPKVTMTVDQRWTPWVNTAAAMPTSVSFQFINATGGLT